MRTAVSPWIGLLAGPTLFLTNMEANFIAVPWVCATGNYWVLHFLHAVALLLILGVLGMAWLAIAKQWFLGTLGVMSAAFSLTLLVAHWIPNFILGACQ
jgi:hypothetical protein